MTDGVHILPRALLAVLLLFSLAGAGEEIPLRIDAPAGADPGIEVPVTGGIPFPRGALLDAGHVRVFNGSEEVPAQVERTALWPDGSVKWIRVDLVLAPGAGRALRIEYGPKVRRAAVEDPLRLTGPSRSTVKGGGWTAGVRSASGVFGPFTFGGKALPHGIRPRLFAVRVSGPDAYPGPSIVSSDMKARHAEGTMVVEETVAEAGGPIRARILARGHFRLSGWGTGLPDRVLRIDPPERVPFTLRFTFYRGSPAVVVDHQIVYTGEPDRDFITRWGVDVGEGAGSTLRVLEPGITLEDGAAGTTVVEGADARLCWAPLSSGLAVLRAGWENRPSEIGGSKGEPARIDFFPHSAGIWDLRRYAREWAVGDTGNKERPEDMERYAKFAARGMAKSQSFVLWLDPETKAPEAAAHSLAGPALLVAPPAWYAQSGVFGAYAPEVGSGRGAELDAGIRRYLDWFLVNQDLFRWHGMLAYGFWQSRYGVHRHDRWDRDYGRWGWSLNDGAGRVGHALMLAWLRTLDRRYFVAGEAFSRAVYDTAMVHTRHHLENARSNWWQVPGCVHRHNVQPFAGPYIGMRGASPYAQRILWHLTGDGVIGDGLDLVAQASLEFATTRPGAFGGSGGPDGQGAGTLALLHAYEKTGEKRYLEACRTILDKSGLIPPVDGRSMGYGPDFGLFLAAAEYLSLTDDPGFEKRFLALADLAAGSDKPERFLVVLGTATRRTGMAKYRSALDTALSRLDFTGSLAELPPGQWPGHGGPLPPPSRGNVAWNLPYALGALEPPGGAAKWPTPGPNPVKLPARAPDGWYRPGGAQARKDRLPDAAKLLGRKTSAGGRAPRTGTIFFPLLGLRGWILAAREDPSGRPLSGREQSFDIPLKGSTSRVTAAGREGTTKWVVSLAPGKADGVAGVRVEMAVGPSRGKERIAGFGVRIPLSLSDEPRKIRVEAGGAFRTERWRVDLTDEAIPQWQNSDRFSRWPLWRCGGVLLGPAGAHRIYRLSRQDVSPVFVDEGVGGPGWLDVSDWGSSPRRGVTVRVLRDPDRATDPAWRGVRFDFERGEIVVEMRSPAGPAGEGPLAGAADVIFHDGWRPPLAKPELTEAQYRRMLDDLDYGENIGLFALRFLLAETHKVRGDRFKDLLAARGIEPREILHGMVFRDGLARHCKRIGVRYDLKDVDGTIRKVIAHYRR